MIEIKTGREIALMAEAGQLVAATLAMLRQHLAAGITTGELDELAEQFIRQRGGEPSFKGLRGYPASICVSVNEEVVHGIPGRRKIAEGDLVSIDLGVRMNGFHGDAAITVAVGRVSRQDRELLQVTEQCLLKAIDEARPGRRLGDIGHAVQSWAERHGFSVVRSLVGHGIGRDLHEEPQVPNFGRPGTGAELKPGMTLAIEPMINAGTHKVSILRDNWTVVTADRRRSAHFEHTVAVTENDPLVLTGFSD
ncbi:MAG: type I methionyl aminopeptidase [Negativicutes bacterium]|nr:type I methionyl aminopeptidase [Negativicutes bacterium]